MLLRPSIERDMINKLPVWHKLQTRMGGADYVSILDDKGPSQTQAVEEANLIITSD